MDNPMKQKNPYQGTVTETFKPDGSRQANIRGPGGNSFQLNQGPDGNMQVTKTESVDFSKVLPFTSLQPAVTAMDQIFGTKMAGAMPSQKDLIQQYRMLEGKEADPMADLKRRLMEAQIKKAEGDGMTEFQRQKLELDKSLKGQQAEEKARQVERLNQKEVRNYMTDIKKSGIPEVNRLLGEISTITSKFEDIPGQGAGAFLPQKLLSEEGKSLREKINKLFNLDLKNRSGAAVTASELERLKKEYGTGLLSTDADIRRMLSQLNAAMEEDLRNIESGADPEAVETYRKRGGRDFASGISERSFQFGSPQGGSSPQWSDAQEKRYQELQDKYKTKMGNK